MSEMMSKINVFNTHIEINNYEFGDCQKLENYFRVYDPVRHSYYYIGIYYDEKNKKLYLPRGIDIWLVEKLFNDNAHVNINKYYKYDTHDDIYIKYLPRDDIQKQALRFMLGKEEYRKIATNSQLSVNLFTGKGKTYISIATLAYTGIKGIIIASRSGWLEQWINKALEYTDMSQKEIFPIAGSLQIQRLMRMSEDKIRKIKLFLVTHDTIQSYASSHGWESIGELFEHLKIGIKIYDEAHLDFNNMCMIDFFTNVYKTYYLTATPIKSSERENQIYQLYFKNIPAIDLFDRDNDPHTMYCAISYNSRPTPMQISDCKNAYGLDRNKYTNYVVYQQNFQELLVILMDIGLKATMTIGQKFLIYIGTNHAINVVKSSIIGKFPYLEYDIGVYTSAVSPEEKQIALTKRIILSTTKSAGAASDIPGLRLTIILAEPFKSEVIARQVLGRTREDNTVCIDVIDQGFSQCSRFYYKKLPVYKTYAKGTSITKLSDQELHDRSANILNTKVPLMTRV